MHQGDWEPDGYFEALDPNGFVWAGSSDRQDVESRMRPGDQLYSAWTRTCVEKQWRREADSTSMVYFVGFAEFTDDGAQYRRWWLPYQGNGQQLEHLKKVIAAVNEWDGERIYRMTGDLVPEQDVDTVMRYGSRDGLLPSENKLAGLLIIPTSVQNDAAEAWARLRSGGIERLMHHQEILVEQLSAAQKEVEKYGYVVTASALLAGWATHLPTTCAGRVCVLHNPTEHHMRFWPIHYRGQLNVFERTCPCGVNHPDPDQTPFWKQVALEAYAAHGCCPKGCCAGEEDEC